MGEKEDRPTPTSATHAAALAAFDGATAAELLAARADGRTAGRHEHMTGHRGLCPYPLGTLAAHVWLRWYVRARLTAAGVAEP